MDIIWLVCLLITHVVAYCIGKGDGYCEADSHEEAWRKVQEYEVYKRFEHMRWLEERKDKHDS